MHRRIWHIICLDNCETVQWRHNGRDVVSNHQPHGCLLKRFFRSRLKKTPKLRVTGLCARNSPGPVNSPHKGPVTRKMFPFDAVIMSYEPVVWNINIKTCVHTQGKALFLDLAFMDVNTNSIYLGFRSISNHKKVIKAHRDQIGYLNSLLLPSNILLAHN